MAKSNAKLKIVESTQEGEFRLIHRASLVSAPENMRKKKRTAESIQNLAALIKGQGGVVQNLIVYEVTSKGKSTGKFAVAGGEGRHQALDWLAEQGEFIDYLVPCMIFPESKAVALSLAENSGREPIHPADEFEAFQRLVNNGTPVEDVAAAFGVSPLVVQRRLKLASVAPEFIELCRDGKASLDALMALTLIDDHDQQRTIWNSLPEFNRDGYSIRRLVVRDEVPASNRFAVFVGEDAYRAAGGAVRQDLFAESGAGYFTDPQLLQDLALASLNGQAEIIESEDGVLWADVLLSEQDRHHYGHVPTIMRQLTEIEQAQIDTLSCKRDELQVQIDEAYESEDESVDVNALEVQVETLDNQIDGLFEKYRIQNPDYAGFAGAILYLNHKGEVVIERNRIRPQDMKAAGRINSANDENGAPPAAPTKAVHSERLTRMLTAHRTAALQAALAQRPDVALVLLAARLAESTFSDFRFRENLLKISPTITHMAEHAPDFKESRAGNELEVQAEEWTKLLAGVEGSVFGWLLTQPSETTHRLLAFCVARTVDTIQQNEKTPIPANTQELASAIGLDMKDWWTPTSGTYFSHVSKARTLDVLSKSGVSAAEHATKKKGDLCKEAEQLIAEKGWLPEVLNFQVCA